MSDWTDSVGWPGDLPFRFYTPVRQAFLATHERHCPHLAEVERLKQAMETVLQNWLRDAVVRECERLEEQEREDAKGGEVTG